MFPDLNDAGGSNAGRRILSASFVTQPPGVCLQEPAGEAYPGLGLPAQQIGTPLPDVAPNSISPSGKAGRWGVILSGGYGTHLLGLTRLVSGDDRPKQFCRLFRGDTLLEQMRIRAERSISGEQILFPLLRAHRPFFLKESGIRPSQRIVQPLDKGTGPAIAHTILSIRQHDKNAIVATLPCDHYYPDEPAFTSALEAAFDVAARHPASVVLLGTPPRSTETVHGWIEPGRPIDHSGDILQVRSFCDRPSPRFARQLIDRGALWNTLIMVGHVDAFLNIITAARAGLANAFNGCLWDGAEVNIADPVYQRFYAVDFSRDVLSIQPQQLLTLRAAVPGWNDLRDPQNLIEALGSVSINTPWMKEWQATGLFMAQAAGQSEHAEPAE
jgi:mannose-1-phosphate guanylyltransferase